MAQPKRKKTRKGQTYARKLQRKRGRGPVDVRWMWWLDRGDDRPGVVAGPMDPKAAAHAVGAES